MARIITKTQAERYCKWLCEEFDFKIKHIDSSDLRWLRRALLVVGVDIDDFRAITMFGRVYIRDIGQLKARPYKLVQLMSHEVRHIVQGRRMGWGKFYSRYVTSLKWRARIEGDGLAGTVDFNAWHGSPNNWIAMDRSLKDYQIGPNRRRKIIKDLRRWEIKHSRTNKNSVAHFWRAAGCDDV